MSAPRLAPWRVQAEAPRVATVALEDELGIEELAQVGQELMRLMYSGTRRVVLDFTEVPHLDYRGVRSLLARVERFREADGDVKLAGLSPYLAAILRAAGAHAAFDCYTTPEEARAAFPPEMPRAWR